MLVAPKGQGTRPTSDRVKEALFAMISSWLGTVDAQPSATLAGIAFLDLYAGSGAVGLEAASRGASLVIMVEKDAATAKLIGDNARHLGLSVSVRAASVPTLAASVGVPCDVCYLDPPYELDSASLDQQIAALFANGWFADRALVIVERSRRSAPPVWPEFIEESWDKRYGDTMLYFGVTQ